MVPVHGCESLLLTIFFLIARAKIERAEHHVFASLCALATDLVNGRGAITTGRRTRGTGATIAGAAAGAAIAAIAAIAGAAPKAGT